MVPGVLKELKDLLMTDELLSMHFTEANKGFLNPSELEAENNLRSVRIHLLYDRLSRKR
jgi:hypothetical protein